MKIIDIWKELEDAGNSGGKYLIRRFSIESVPDIYVAYRISTGEKGIAISISAGIEIDINSYTNLKDLKLETVQDDYKPENNLLLILLSSPQHIEVFTVLCTDLIQELSLNSLDEKHVKDLFARLEMWMSLFERLSNDILSAEAQRGLFGELYFLKNWSGKNKNYSHCINAWLGPTRAIRDFQFGNWALEIKTTHGNNHQRINISSERQLDISKLDYLFLFHISLESRLNDGISLNQMVQSIRNLLQDDFISLNRFNMKLIEAGYFDRHENAYAETGYVIRNEYFYRVYNEFPRIEENDIRPGVGDVQYSIIVSQASEYQVSEDFIFKILL
jgi:hypothetical protein